MSETILLTGAVVGALALAVTPLLLPWPSKLRWIVTAESMNPFIAVSNARRHVILDEVVIAEVDDGGDEVHIVIRPDQDEEPAHRRELFGSAGALAKRELLNSWYRDGTPLLLIEDDKLATLQGPHDAVSGLHEW